MKLAFEKELNELEAKIKDLIDEFHKTVPWVWISRVEYHKPYSPTEKGKLFTYMLLGSGAGWPVMKHEEDKDV